MKVPDKSRVEDAVWALMVYYDARVVSRCGGIMNITGHTKQVDRTRDAAHATMTKLLESLEPENPRLDEIRKNRRCRACGSSYWFGKDGHWYCPECGTKMELVEWVEK